MDEGRLEELKTEIFGKGVLDMLKKGNISSDSTLALFEYFQLI